MSETEGWDNGEWWADFERSVLKELVPMMRESNQVISILADPDEVDVKVAVETGLAILMDKPIIVIAFAGRPVPGKLRKAADEVVELESLTELGAREKVIDAIKRTREAE